MIRLLEIGIMCYDRKLEELGCPLPEDSPSKAFIDLDRVESVYELPDQDIMIKLKSGDSYLTKSYRLDGFVNIWINGGMNGYVLSQSGGIK